ncbi:MAG: hypothetical protein ACE5D4_05650 [Thermodesulfobacteriota bacterium]
MGNSITYRRRFFINKGLQSRFILIFALIVVVAFLLNWQLVYYMVDKELAVELYKSHIKIRTTGEIIKPVLIKMNMVLIPLLAVVTASAVMLLTRAIELPIAGFRDAVVSFGEGRLDTRFTGEAPGDLAAGFNALAERYEGSFVKIEEEISALEDVAARLEDRVKQPEPPVSEMSDMARALDSINTRIAEELSRFKV